MISTESEVSHEVLCLVFGRADYGLVLFRSVLGTSPGHKYLPNQRMASNRQSKSKILDDRYKRLVFQAAGPIHGSRIVKLLERKNTKVTVVARCLMKHSGYGFVHECLGRLVSVGQAGLQECSCQLNEASCGCQKYKRCCW